MVSKYKHKDMEYFAIVRGITEKTAPI